MINTQVKMYVTFYDNLISSGTKIEVPDCAENFLFYDNLISSGTKIRGHWAQL